MSRMIQSIIFFEVYKRLLIKGVSLLLVRIAEYSTILQEAQIPIVDQQVCIDQFPIDYITDNMLCAGVPGSDPDSCTVSSVNFALFY